MQTKEITTIPNLLDIYRELDTRECLDYDQQQELYRLERGDTGEKKVVEYLEEFGQDHWQILTNIWLYEYGLFEIDCLLLTKTDIYLFEIKNYNGDFKYANSQCYFSDDIISHNPISQTQRCKVNLQNILSAVGMRVTVNANLVFAGEHTDIEIQDYIEDLDVLTINQLRKLIYSIANNEQTKLDTGKRPLNRRKILRIIEHAKRKSPYQPQPLSQLEQSRLRKGIKCANCGSFDLNTARSYLICKCGLHEPREMAIVRTICEYGVINFDKDLHIADLHNFFGGDISRVTITKYLRTYFVQNPQKNGLVFVNTTKKFNDIINTFPFTRDRYLVF